MNGEPRDDRLKYAGFGVRLGGIAVDLFLVSMVSTLLTIFIIRSVHSTLSTTAVLRFFFFFLLPVSLFIQVLYFAWFNANGRQSLGKRLFGIAVVDTSLQPIQFRQSLGRAAAFYMDTLLIGLGHLPMLFNSQKKTLHDILAKTYVVRIKPRRRFEPLLSVVALIGLILIPTNELLRSYLKSFRIPTGSLKPTLLIGDFIVVDMYWAKKSIPRQGDIFVFKFPADTRLDYIERCIGLPGDTVEIRHGIVWVNRKQERLQLVKRENDPEEGHNALEYEVKPEDRQPYRIRHYEDHNINLESYGPVVVPDNHYFAMGDNRDNSSDSRYWGFVPQENIIGKAGIIYWSWDRSVPLSRLKEKIRWSRIGNVLQ
ncbi:MAG: signal peptidase I [bacterium]